MIVPSRRSFITGLVASLVAAPAVVRAASLMPVRALVPQKITYQGIELIFDDPNAIVDLLVRRMAEAERILFQNMQSSIYDTSYCGQSGLHGLLS